MARDLADYIALALVRNKDEDSFFGASSDLTGDLNQLREKAESLCGFRMSEATFNKALRALADCGLVRITDDPYSGTFARIRCSELKSFFQKAESDLAKADEDYGGVTAIISQPSDYPAASALLKHELFEDYNELGSDWLSRALAGLREKIGPSGSIEDLLDRADRLTAIAAPASDRIVTLQHNQILETDNSITELVDALEDDNGNPDDPGLRERLLGQIKAGRELIRAGEFRAYLLYEVLVRALGELIEKYGNPTIKALANALLGAIVSQFFQAS